MWWGGNSICYLFWNILQQTDKDSVVTRLVRRPIVSRKKLLDDWANFFCFHKIERTKLGRCIVQLFDGRCIVQLFLGKNFWTTGFCVVQLFLGKNFWTMGKFFVLPKLYLVDSSSKSSNYVVVPKYTKLMLCLNLGIRFDIYFDISFNITCRPMNFSEPNQNCTIQHYPCFVEKKLDSVEREQKKPHLTMYSFWCAKIGQYYWCIVNEKMDRRKTSPKKTFNDH